MSEGADRREITVPPASRLAVLGSPIAHSKSPAIHAAAYEVLGLDWSYGRHEVQAADLEAFLADCGEEWRGLSLTMPLKEEAHRLASVLDPVATESGVVNTLLRLPGAAGWAGFNTDVEGLAAAILEQGLDATEVSVLGAGATAVSAVLAARRLGAERVHVFARRLEAAQHLAARFDGTAEPGGGVTLRVSAEPLMFEASEFTEQLQMRKRVMDTTLVISTLPAAGVNWQQISGPVGIAPVFDVAYDPWPSALAMISDASGQPAFAGTAMLLEQAVRQVRIFRDGDPSVVLPDEDLVRQAMHAAA